MCLLWNDAVGGYTKQNFKRCPQWLSQLVQNMSWNPVMFTGASLFLPPLPSPGTVFVPPPTCWETPWEPALLNTCHDMNWRTGTSKWVTQWLKRMKWRNHISWLPRKAKLRNPLTVRPRCRLTQRNASLSTRCLKTIIQCFHLISTHSLQSALYLPFPPCPDRIGKYSSKNKGGFCSGQNV